jgi:hypothetical protein
MTFIVETLPRARDDILRTFARLISHSPQGAQTWLDAFDRARDDLAETAEAFSVLPESKKLGTRLRSRLFQTPQGLRYQIIYRIDKFTSTVLIYRLLAPGQRPLRRKDLP